MCSNSELPEPEPNYGGSRPTCEKMLGSSYKTPDLLGTVDPEIIRTILCLAIHWWFGARWSPIHPLQEPGVQIPNHPSTPITDFLDAKTSASRLQPM